MSTTTPTMNTQLALRRALGLGHLLRLSDGIGILEHAEFSRPRPEHGYCTDDNARLCVLAHDLLVTSAVRDDVRRRSLERLASIGLRFALDAQDATGAVHNRRGLGGGWTDEPEVNDSWGRALHAFGVARGRARTGWERRAAALAFDRGCRRRTHHLRSMAFASLGAAAVLDDDPGHQGALDLLADTADLIWSTRTSAAWPWPEARLTYANATIPEALIAAAAALDRGDELIDALDLLEWLIGVESTPGHLSVTPVTGRSAGDRDPGFDQQPIEVAAIATACRRAARHDGATGWQSRQRLAAGWFLGANDLGQVMIDPVTGGGYDGLTVDGANLNQGAESTMAMLTAVTAGISGSVTVLDHHVMPSGES
jgi:hypothetical protein